MVSSVNNISAYLAPQTSALASGNTAQISTEQIPMMSKEQMQLMIQLENLIKTSSFDSEAVLKLLKDVSDAAGSSKGGFVDIKV